MSSTGLIDLERCDVDEVFRVDISATDFLHRYALSSRPLAIRGGCREWDWTERWTKGSFLEEHESQVFEVSDVPYKDNFYGRIHGAGVNRTLEQFSKYSKASRTALIIWRAGS